MTVEGRIRRERAKIKREQAAALAAAAAQPDVPAMESLIHQAVANNSREIGLKTRAEAAERKLANERDRIEGLLLELSRSKDKVIAVQDRLIGALEDVSALRDRLGNR